MTKPTLPEEGDWSNGDGLFYWYRGFHFTMENMVEDILGECDYFFDNLYPYGENTEEDDRQLIRDHTFRTYARLIYGSYLGEDPCWHILRAIPTRKGAFAITLCVWGDGEDGWVRLPLDPQKE